MAVLDGSMWTGVLLGTLGAISTDRWLIAWMCFEINLFSFVLFINKDMMLYFIVQSVGSMIIISGIFYHILSSLGLLLKMSLVPFHFWGARIIDRIGNATALLFLTWQKIAPLFILLKRSSFYLLTYLIVNAVWSICSTGARCLKVLLFFSGLLHSSWMITGKNTALYFILYCISLAPLLILNISNANVSLLIFNMAGIPPLTGFFIKFYVLQLVRFWLSIILITFSFFTVYAYLRVFLKRIKGPLRYACLVTLIGIFL